MMTSAKGSTYFQNLDLKMLQNLYLNFLCAQFDSSWTNIKQIKKGVPVAPPTQPIWPQKKPTSVESR